MFTDPINLTLPSTGKTLALNGGITTGVLRLHNADNGKSVRVGPDGLTLTVSHQQGKDNRSVVRLDKTYVDSVTGAKRQASIYFNLVNPVGLNGAVTIDSDVLAFFESSLLWLFSNLAPSGFIADITPQFPLDRIVLLEP